MTWYGRVTLDNQCNECSLMKTVLLTTQFQDTQYKFICFNSSMLIHYSNPLLQTNQLLLQNIGHRSTNCTSAFLAYL